MTTLPTRKPLRLKGYDYNQGGAYFVTVCTQNRLCLLGDVVNGEMVLNDAGRMVEAVWQALPTHYPNIGLDAFVVMPNHVHGIIFVGDGFKPSRQGFNVERAGLKPAPTHGLPEIVRAFKTFSSRKINQHRQTAGVPVWQRGYYDHVVRNEADLDRIRLYIAHNPAQWPSDEHHPNANAVGVTHVSPAENLRYASHG